MKTGDEDDLADLDLPPSPKKGPKKGPVSPPTPPPPPKPEEPYKM